MILIASELTDIRSLRKLEIKIFGNSFQTLFFAVTLGIISYTLEERGIYVRSYGLLKSHRRAKPCSTPENSCS